MQASQLAIENKEVGERLAKEMSAKHAPLSQSSAYATGVFVQFRTLIAKFGIMYWRSPSYNVTRLVMTVRSALECICSPCLGRRHIWLSLAWRGVQHTLNRERRRRPCRCPSTVD